MPNDPRVLIDYRTSDDAGVYRLDGERSLVQTVDFFTPIVDDPFVYGQIAAANALSDVYAMGGRPLTALAIAAFPKEADRAVLATIFKGGLDKLTRGRGGASRRPHRAGHRDQVRVRDHRPGAPSAIWSNAGAQAGDVLILTKAARHRDHLHRAQVPARARGGSGGGRPLHDDAQPAAAEALQSLPAGVVHACTDVTGFGLIGHASEMAAASGCTLEIEAVGRPAAAGGARARPGQRAGRRTYERAAFGGNSRVSRDIDPDLVQLFYDPQTSGGLLVAVDGAHAGQAANALHAAGVPAARVGRVLPPTGARVTVR